MMSDHITLRVDRYRPERESEIRFEDFELPCPKEWVVLDGLNHIKDQLDAPLVVPHGDLRQLRDARQRRSRSRSS